LQVAKYTIMLKFVKHINTHTNSQTHSLISQANFDVHVRNHQHIHTQCVSH